MPVTGFDHIALPTANAERLLEFYVGLGFDTEHVEDWRAGRYPIFSIVFGDNKINVHPEQLVAIRDRPEYLRGPTAEPGCGDVCFVWSGGIDLLLARLRELGIEPISGPVLRVGGRASGASQGASVYIRDPDQNLVEFISYQPDDVKRVQPKDDGDETPPELRS